MTMTYQELLTSLKDKHKILIAGSQRSGTTIATKMLANDLGYQDYYEEQIGSHWATARERFKRLCDNESNFVCQAPHLTAFCTEFDCDAVVFMARQFKDIEESAKRIGWMKFENEEKEAFKTLDREEDGFVTEYFGKDFFNLPIWDIKKRFYAELTGDKYLILNYSELKTHPLFITKEKRRNFHPRQTSL